MEKKKNSLASSMPVFGKKTDKSKAKKTEKPEKKVTKILKSPKETENKEVKKSEKKVEKKSEKVKAPKKALFKKKDKGMSVYSSLSYRRKARKEMLARKHAEELADMPKNPVLRFFAHLHPKRVLKFIFSKRGLFFFLKSVAAIILLGIIALGGLFLYYKKDLESIRLDEMKVSESVNVYLDRNGEVLWEDRGDGDYRLVVDADKIPEIMRQATVAIEDRNFYNHNGIDLTGITRAAWSIVTHQGVQGGSTLTQQLIKQVYFADEAASENRGGLARKIKEMILAIEVEKMYNKEQDGLLQEWDKNKVVWLNPPYSSKLIKAFVKKLSEHNNGIAIVVNRTDNLLFQEIIFPKAKSMLFMRRRVKFINPNGEARSPMFGSCLIAFGDECDRRLRESGIEGKYVKLN